MHCTPFVLILIKQIPVFVPEFIQIVDVSVGDCLGSFNEFIFAVDVHLLLGKVDVVQIEFSDQRFCQSSPPLTVPNVVEGRGINCNPAQIGNNNHNHPTDT